MSIKKKDFLRVTVRRTNERPRDSQTEEHQAYTVDVDPAGELTIHGLNGTRTLSAESWSQITIERRGEP